ncbi:MAG: hypothetical protein K2M47_02615 [Clostridiales bacterium]|nr:hypothetical protein [Clostridiales bacterium]
MAVVKAGCGGNFQDGLRCRMVIEVKRVFDGCATTDENITLTLTTVNQIPQGAEFVSARVIGSEFEGFSVTSCGDGCSRVVGEIVTTFAVTYSANGQLTTVQATYRENKDVLLRLPFNNTAVTFSIEVQTNMNIAGGAIIGTNAVSISGCRIQIIKVTAPVDILVPTYGYCQYPPCTGCACPGVDNIFPTFGDEET